MENHAYSTEISPWFFALAGRTALVIALTTAGFQSARGTRVNPAEALKNA